MLALDGSSPHRPDPVRARVGAGQQLTNSQTIPVRKANNADAQAARRRLYLLADTRGTGPRGPRGPHPGDVLYWVACLGGACLLLLSATT
jgi:hypothetical protein